MNINERIKQLREKMKEKGIKAYIVPTFDPHQSEYLADYYMTRVWISGFTGSAGTVVVTEDKAILWTDGRYFIQAEKELASSEIELFKMNTPGYPSYAQWLKENLKEGEALGFNGEIYPQAGVEKLEKTIGKDLKLVDEYDLVGEIWEDRPKEPKTKAFVHDVKYTGKTAREKIEELRKRMEKKDASHTLIGSLDDIAWLYNIRGRDVECNPVVISYALVSQNGAWLFVNKEKLDEEVLAHLKENGIEVKGYEEVRDYVEKIDQASKIYLDPNRVNRWLYKGIPETCEVVKGTNLTTEMKAIKNSTEIENQKNAYIKDGVALTKFVYWLDKNVGKTKITEATAEDKLEEFRKEQDGFLEPSFNTIAAYKENAAMMHYSADEDTAYELKREKMFLVDSGGQYYDGTTDVTRTIVLGEITEEEKKDYTLTLKGHINLLNSRFLHGTTGSKLDGFARYPLWQEGLDYKCGTGHGIGFMLNVHEGPHSLGMTPNNTVLDEGMVVTIEPGVYKDGKHGVRIENVAIIAKDIETESGQFMKFKNISYCPIDLEGVDVELLSESERKWLNDYHEEVYEKISPFLNEEEREWLKEETRNI